MCSRLICNLVSRHVSGQIPSPWYGSISLTVERQSLGHPSSKRNRHFSIPCLNVRNLGALGAERLAELLIEISKSRPVARRLLRLELAGAEGTAEPAREVRKQLITIRRSRAVIDSPKRWDLVGELEIHRRVIVDHIAGEDAAEALDLM